MVAGSTDLHLRIKIDLWLAEVHLACGERAAAAEAVGQAGARLVGRERLGLLAWAEQLPQALHR